MKIKKIIAGIVASAMAVSTLAIAASADALLSKEGNDQSSANYSIDFSSLTEEQVKSITKIEASVSVTTSMVNGCIGYNKADAGWTSVNQELNVDGGSNLTGTWVAEAEAGSFASLDEAGAIAPYCEVQFWWVNPVYDEAGNESGKGVATLNSVTVYDASGAVLLTVGAAASPADTEAPAATEAPTTEGTGAAGDTTAPTPDKNSPNTGIEGVAVVAGLAIIAAGAVVVAKKRK